MREIEKNIFLIVNQSKNDKDNAKKEVLGLVFQLMKEPFGKSTPEFLQNSHLPIFKELVEETTYLGFYQTFILWEMIENYIVLDQKRRLDEIECFLKTIIEAARINNVHISPHILAPNFIRNIYLCNNINLINLFSKYLPIPRLSIFNNEDSIPKIIQDKEKEYSDSLNSILSKFSLLDLENDVKNIQRKQRKNRRYKEELSRIDKVYGKYLEENGVTSNDLIKAANTPYMPQAQTTEIGERIFKALKNENFRLFETLVHYTSLEALQNIFDNSLCGSKTLSNSYMVYRKASLSLQDIINGDIDSICFGKEDGEVDINSQTKANTVRIIFKLDKLRVRNAFYKQADFGYYSSHFNTISRNKFSLNNCDRYFSITEEPYNLSIKFKENKNPDFDKNYSDYRFFMLYDGNGDLIAYSKLPNALFIGYNLEEMHQILTLNFFRFLDSLKKMDGTPANQIKETIYKEISQLEDQKLIIFLKEIGKKITKTMEFNIFGSHKIDLSSVISIQAGVEQWFSAVHRKNPSNIEKITSPFKLDSNPNIDQFFILDLEDFILNLNRVQYKKEAEKLLDKPLKNLGIIFKSYRFLDYVLSEVKKPESKKILEELRAVIFKTPPRDLSIDWMYEVHRRTYDKDYDKELKKDQIPATSIRNII